MAVIKVWVHPARGSDYYHSFKSKEKANEFSRTHKRAEAPLVSHKGKEYNMAAWAKFKKSQPKPTHKRKPRGGGGLFGGTSHLFKVNKNLFKF